MEVGRNFHLFTMIGGCRAFGPTNWTMVSKRGIRMTAKERAEAILALVPAKKRPEALELLRAQWHEADQSGRRGLAGIIVSQWREKRFRIADLEAFIATKSEG
jgi:hypothetical protein